MQWHINTEDRKVGKWLPNDKLRSHYCSFNANIMLFHYISIIIMQQLVQVHFPIGQMVFKSADISYSRILHCLYHFTCLCSVHKIPIPAIVSYSTLKVLLHLQWAVSQSVHYMDTQNVLSCCDVFGNYFIDGEKCKQNIWPYYVWMSVTINLLSLYICCIKTISHSQLWDCTEYQHGCD